jgi:hypothetical protein
MERQKLFVRDLEALKGIGSRQGDGEPLQILSVLHFRT